MLDRGLGYGSLCECLSDSDFYFSFLNLLVQAFIFHELAENWKISSPLMQAGIIGMEGIWKNDLSVLTQISNFF